MKKAFTLAEVLITLTVIGIITAVIIPVAIHSKPDEKIMKFKKAHNTLYQVISTLINSDEYYLNGDLGIMPNGKRIDETTDDNKKYFCKSFADVITTKSTNCSTVENSYYIHALPNPEDSIFLESCKKTAKSVGKEIISTDGTVYYQADPAAPFGVKYSIWDRKTAMNKYYNGEYTCGVKLGLYYLTDGGTCETIATGMYRIYKILCVDIDGFPSEGSENCDDIKDICPFPYGIRVDGKILVSKRVNDWLEKSIQGEN